jgi:CDP-4-dehydro-6-deoxyglucose reductase
MPEITLKNNKTFFCSNEQTIFEAGKSNGILLDHSCLAARCRSCKAKLLTGAVKGIHEENVLTQEEKQNGFILTCNSIPSTDVMLDIEDLDGSRLFFPKTIPSKVSSIEKLNDQVIELTLRIPPNGGLQFNPGQYVNLTINGIKRSYSIACNDASNNQVIFFIKHYPNGLMSNYLFNVAKANDMFRMEGPLGTFYHRETTRKNIIFLATGTGVAPIKSILDDFEISSHKTENREIWFFWGARDKNDFFWNPRYKNFNLNYIPVLSRKVDDWHGDFGYVQDVVLKKEINLADADVYACGSETMINASLNLLKKNGLNSGHFYSDAFVMSN